MDYEELFRKYKALSISNGHYKKKNAELKNQIKQLSYFISKNVIDKLVKEKKQEVKTK